MPSSFIEKNLQPGELVRYRGRPSKSAALLRPAVLLALFLILDGIDHSLRNSVTTASSQGAKTGAEIVVGILLFFVLLALVVTTIAAIAFLSSAQYAVTDRRVVAKYGLIRRSSVDLFLTKISGVKVDQGLLGRAFDFGNVVVQSSGASRRIVLLKSPKAFQSAILTQLDDSPIFRAATRHRRTRRFAIAALSLEVRTLSNPPKGQCQQPTRCSARSVLMNPSILSSPITASHLAPKVGLRA